LTPVDSASATVRRAARKLGARCDLCPLSKEKPVPSEPNRTPLKLVIVGEGPGRTEVKLGRPFVGLSGQLLNQLLARNRIRRSECFILNTALCRGESDRDNERAAACCTPRLLQELSELPQEIPIATLGKSATQAVLGLKNSFLQMRGFIWTVPETDPKKIAAQRKSAHAKSPKSPARGESDLRLACLERRAKLAERVVLPTIHPAFVLRADSWHAVIRLDFARIGKAVRGEIPKKLEDQRARPTVLSTIRTFAQLSALGPTISLDVETTKAKSPLFAKLLCVGLSDSKRTFVVWPWKPKLAKPLSKFLRSRQAVVGHNTMGFDKVVLEAHGVA
jgi:uracil-DNA glycosylase family 4